ncbi:phosphoadenylyl-sulfate reductase [Cognatiyoonia sp. IB215182]|uniref:phosphoadenylyl-sulfate reductase n=1 Tax=Cognatiyoonia sp. IB215182 TaxID=3097353 RepID=UPI002A0F4C4D|nr:phosphoadenylyl-sulfate reductase [Cognatiyoonia sp. IB215182]MDX8353292.1 phosphoadenylyl-sulfate reductase [Cognatiyoonia sp. IB215182]
MPLKELAERRNILHRKSDAQIVLKHALDDVQIGPVALVSSFGAESVVLLHMIAEIDKATPIIFLDTEMLFPETLTYQREVAEHLGLTDVRIIGPDRNEVLVEDVDGILHQADTDACCDLRKTRPLNRALQDFGGWITGRKRYQGGQRSTLPLFEKDGAKIKINPLANWTTKDVQDYMNAHALPRHPLVAQGYPSIGCMPCTTRVSAHEDPRAGRWRDSDKTECGIHFDNGKAVRPGKAA